MAKDVIHTLITNWKKQESHWNVDSMGIVGRLMILGNLLTKRANRLFENIGLGYTDFDVLATLRRQGSPYQLTPTELRNSVLLTSGAMTACLDRLETKSLIARKRASNDRRVVVIHLTKKGLALVNNEAPKRFADSDEVVSSLSESEKNQLEKLLTKLLGELS